MTRDEYDALVGVFSVVTSRKQVTGTCCRLARNGVPECCFRIVDGEELTYTAREAALLPMLPLLSRPDGMYVLDRSFWTRERLLESLWRGDLSRTLESVSHPTRPVVAGDNVVAVAVIDGCNREVSDYAGWKDVLLALWQMALELGVKPYYGVPGRVKESWMIL